MSLDRARGRVACAVRNVGLFVFCAACSAHSTAPQPDLGLVPATACGPIGYAAEPFVTAVPVRSFPAPDQTIVTGRDYFAVLETDAGCVALDLYEQQAPVSTNSFVFLALHHSFDGTAFHRVIDGFVAQGGDPNTVAAAPSAWGYGDPGYAIDLEVTPALNFDGPGVVGLAHADDPNGNGSQFFITLAAADSLDQQYSIFARVTAGLDVLPKIVRGEPPTSPTRITTATIVSRLH